MPSDSLGPVSFVGMAFALWIDGGFGACVREARAVKVYMELLLLSK